MSPFQRFALWRAKREWLRDPAGTLARLHAAGGKGVKDGESLGVGAWLALTYERDEARAERLARRALTAGGDARMASAALAEVLARRGEHDEAVAVLRQARDRRPEVFWYEITLADALLEAGRASEAEELLERALDHEQLRRHALKRLSRWALDRGDAERARRWFADLIAIAPNYLVYASDYVILGRLQLEAGAREAARETWRQGADIYPRNGELRRLRADHFGEEPPASARPRIAPVAEDTVGAHRIAVRTPMITARTGLERVVDTATAAERRPGDVIAIGESPAAAGQGRIVPLELVKPGRLARLLSRFVGEIGPLHSPEGMQGAILEAGRARVLAGAVAGALGKLVGRRGWFYRVAGPATAMIDDVAAAMPPHDHHVVFGPRDPAALAADLAGSLGCGVAIVDANHLTGAWAVGVSPGVDPRWVEAALADNPAGNEDERTPVVILRPVGAGTAAGGGRLSQTAQAAG